MNAMRDSRSDDVQRLIREVIEEVLSGKIELGNRDESSLTPTYKQELPVERKLTLSVSGNERSINILQEALKSGDGEILEIAVRTPSGPKAKVVAKLQQ